MSAATNFIRKALEADPTNWETRQALVESLMKDGDVAEACALMCEIDVQAKSEQLLIDSAMQFSAAGHHEEARLIVQGVLDRHPGSALAHVGLAKVAHARGDGKVALRHYITATSIDPDMVASDLEAAYGALLEAVSPRPVKEIEKEPEPSVVEPPSVPDSPAEPELPVRAARLEPVSPPPPPPPAAPEPALQAAALPDTTPPPAPVQSAPPLEPKAKPAPAAKVEDESANTPRQMASPAASSVPNLVPEKVAAEADKLPAKGADLDLGEGPPVIVRERRVSEDGEDEFEGDQLADEVKMLRDEIEAKRKRSLARDKMTSLTVTILLHVVAFVLLTLAVVSTPFRDAPPSLVAVSTVADRIEDIQQANLNKNQIKKSASAASPTADFISATGASAVAMTPTEIVGEVGVGTAVNADVGLSFSPSMSFGEAGQSMNSKMLFGQKLDMKGDLLGVILDVSGSMAEYLPFVVKEIDRNFKNAPIVYVNHAGMVGTGKDTKVLGIVKDEVLPSWPREWKRGSSPYWFLWGDLPRKAEQRYVDRLIETFKTRPNMFIAVGGANRVGAAAKFLSDQNVDGLYVFSDFADFVDSEFCDGLGRTLGRSKVRTYVQPVDAARTDHFQVMVKEVANRSLGRELPPLSELLRPGDLEPIAVEVKKELPVPTGVKFATPRPGLEADPARSYAYNPNANERDRFKDVLKVVEYPNFDIVIRGPEAKFYLFLKTKEGYIQDPIVFNYHAHNPYYDSEHDEWHYPRRKWLRNQEEPGFDGNEFTWKMILEDEVLFQVILWFKEDTVTVTYTCDPVPNGESNGAYIGFGIPPSARESKDKYYSLDFPEGLSLDDLRMAMAHNTATFYLPRQLEDSMGVSWSRLGFKKGENVLPYNVMYRSIPSAVREVTIGGRSYGERRLQARTTSNSLLLGIHGRADMELFEGFGCTLSRPGDRRHRIQKTEAIAIGIE
jgi:hypothetical protein